MDHAHLKSIIDYNPETGVFRWAVDLGMRAKKGGVAGTIKEDGYRIIFMKRKRYAAHRLAWFYVTGVWPPHDIDHVNRSRDDNRFANLRLANRTQNNANRPARSGLKGASPAGDKFQARISIHGKQIYLGVYSSEQAAHAAYCAAAKKLFGDFWSAG